MEVLVLHIIPYESSRKRMSMIVEMADGSIYLFTKVRSTISFFLANNQSRALTAFCWNFVT